MTCWTKPSVSASSLPRSSLPSYLAAATAQTDFDIQKNGSSFGTMLFGAQGTTASFISVAGATFNAGDVLKVIAPASPDATLSGPSFLLSGTR